LKHGETPATLDTETMPDKDLALSRKVRESPEVSEFLGFLVRELSFRRSPSFLMNRVVEGIAFLFKAEAASLLLLNEETGLLDFVVIKGLNDQAIKELDVHLKPDEGLAGWALTHAKPVVVNDPSSDARFKARVDLLTGFKTRNLMAAPLRLEGKPFGVLEVLNRKKREPFTEMDAALLATLSPLLVTAFHNIHLFHVAETVQAQFKAVMENMPEGFLAVDRRGRLTHANPRALELMEWGDPPLGKGLADLFMPIPSLRQGLEKVLAEERSLPLQTSPLSGRRGTRSLSYTIFPLMTPGRTLGGAAVLLREIA
jgi:GAF domain-containing protein